MKVGQLPPLSLPFTAAFCSIPTLILLQKLNAHLKSRICSLLLSFLTPPRVSTLAVSWALQAAAAATATLDDHIPQPLQ